MEFAPSLDIVINETLPALQKVNVTLVLEVAIILCKCIVITHLHAKGILSC